MNDAAKSYLYVPGESEARWMGETSSHFLATGPLIDGAFALVEERATQGVGVPLHRHAKDTESFYILEGEVSFYLGDQAAQRASVGAFVHVPGGTVHGFRIDSSVVKRACDDFEIEFVGRLPD